MAGKSEGAVKLLQYSDSHSVLEVDIYRERPQSLSQDAGMVALLEHVEVHSFVVLESHSLCLLMCFE